MLQAEPLGYIPTERTVPIYELTETEKYGIPDETVQAIKDDAVAELIELGGTII